MRVMQVYPERRHLPLRVCIFIDFLVENLNEKTR
jgi:hypothetical protein